MSNTYWIKWGVGRILGDWEKIEAENEEAAENLAYDNAMEEAEMEINFEVTDKNPDE